MAKRKSTKGQTTIYKHIYKTNDRVKRTPLKTGGELMCSGRVSSSCTTSGTRRVNLVRNLMISHEWRKDQEVFTKIGTYPWSFVTQIFHNGQSRNIYLDIASSFRWFMLTLNCYLRILVSNTITDLVLSYVYAILVSNTIADLVLSNVDAILVSNTIADLVLSYVYAILVSNTIANFVLSYVYAILVSNTIADLVLSYVYAILVSNTNAIWFCLTFMP
jgi:hypothetical protein